MHFTTVAPPLNQCYPLWEKHALSSAQADPFCCTPAWQLAFHDAFSPRRRLFIVESADATLAFAEKVFPNNSVFLTPIEPHWFFGCPLLGKDALALFAAALDFFASQYQQFPHIFISGIRPAGRFARQLLRMCEDRFAIFLHSWGVQGWLPLLAALTGICRDVQPIFEANSKKPSAALRKPEFALSDSYQVLLKKRMLSIPTCLPWKMRVGKA